MADASLYSSDDGDDDADDETAGQLPIHGSEGRGFRPRTPRSRGEVIQDWLEMELAFQIRKDSLGEGIGMVEHAPPSALHAECGCSSKGDCRAKGRSSGISNSNSQDSGRSNKAKVHLKESTTRREHVV